MAYSGIDPGLISPYRAKSRKYQRIGDLFKMFGDIRQQKFLRDRQAAADERALAKHGYQMDIYKARLAELSRAEAEAKRQEEARLTDQEWAAIEAKARGHSWEPTFGVDASPADWGEPDVVDPQAHRMVQYGMLPGQTPWPSNEKYLESLAARHRSGRGTSPELAQVLSRLASMRATEALGEGRKAKNIRDAVGGMQVDEGDIPLSNAQRIKSLSEQIKENIEKNRYNEFADPETGENAGITKAEFQRIKANVWKAASEMIKKYPQLSRDDAVDLIINAPAGVAKAYSTSNVNGQQITDYVPRSAEEILKLLYNKYVEQPVDEYSGGGGLIVKPGSQQVRPAESKQVQAQQRYNELNAAGLKPEAIKAQLKSEGLL